MTPTHKLLPLAVLAAVTFAACDDDDPIIEAPNEEELITTVTLVLTSGSDVVTFTQVDLDGDGGTDATVTGGSLAAGTTYDYAVTFLNATETPPEDITVEVREEDEEHQVFVAFEGVAATLADQDLDDDGRPLGVTGEITVADTASGSGFLTVTLVHEPNKDAAGVADGDITNAGGETDVEARFPVDIR